MNARSATLFRCSAALFLIVDACLRWPYLEAFYTQAGVFPLHTGVVDLSGASRLTLLDWVHSLAGVKVFVAGGILASACWLIGWQTRLAHLACAVYFMSLINRNGLVCLGGDRIFASLLLLSLPIDTTGAISADSPGRSSRFGEWALRLFLPLVYLVIASQKTGQTWLDGTALCYVLESRQLAGPIGRWLAEQPLALLKGLTWTALAIEWMGPLLLLAGTRSNWARRAGLALLGALHAGIAACLPSIWQFQAVMLVGLTVWLEGPDWDGLGRRFAEARRVLEDRLRRLPYASRREPPLWALRAAEGLVAVLALAAFVHSYGSVAHGFPALPAAAAGPLERVHEVLPLARSWRFFAPNPPRVDGWWVADAETASGEHVDLWTGSPVDWDRPARFDRRFNRYWRETLNWTSKAQFVRLQPYIGAWLLRKAAQDGLEVRRLRLCFMLDPTPAPGAPRGNPTPLILWVGRPVPKTAPSQNVARSQTVPVDLWTLPAPRLY